MKEEIKSLFPTPIYFSKLERKLNEEELLFIKNNKKNIFKSDNNSLSEDTYILNNPVFNNLKKELLKNVKNYFNKIICPSNNITPYITQSWITYTEEKEHHNKHDHQNSLISGVFYVEANKNYDNIKFFKKETTMLRIETKDFNLFNSGSWWFPVETSQIILFPSYLSHCIENKKGKDTRISLAFNVFVKGELGLKKELTYLKI
jgi:uncharacterized protein (TIGR02466 family)